MSELADRLQQALPERYTLEREIGRGHHTVVFLAHERHPRRDVAIKVIQPEIAGALNREQFLAEVGRPSNITHPHIVPIYAAGDTGEFLYYVTPYVEGESLRDRLRARAPLPVSEALHIASDAADAVAFAHRQGVLHLDLKPENILLHDGNPLVADFGIARAVADARGGGTSETGSGQAAAGVSPADEGDDVRSLGRVLFEMLAGEEPPARSADASVLRARMPNVPDDVRAAVERALAPTSQSGFRTAAEFATALSAARAARASASHEVPAARRAHRRGRWWTGVAGLAIATVVLYAVWRLVGGTGGALGFRPGTYVDSVAVMPVENRTGDAWFDTVGDALTFEVVSGLQKIPDLKTSAYTSVRAQGGDSLGLAAIGKALGVRLLLVPQFRQVGERVRLDAELVEAATGRLVLSDQWPVTTRNEPRLLNDLGTGLVRLIALGTGLASRPQLAPRAGPAHHDYVLGKYWLGRRTPQGIKLAIQHFTNAVRLDTASAQAYEGLSTAYVLALFYRYDIGLDGYEAAGRSLAAANRAVALDPAFASAYAARGYVTSRTYGPWRDAARDFSRALDLEPNSAQAVAWSASALIEEGKIDEGIDATRRAIDLDPLSPARQLSLAYVALPLGRYDLVIESAHRATELEPELAISRALEGRALLLAGRADDCVKLGFGPHEGVRAACLYDLGRRTDAAAIIDSITRVVRNDGSRDTVYTDVVRLEDLAVYYAWVGDVDRALQWLRETFRLSPIGVERRVLQSALFKKVRDDPEGSRELDAIIAQIWPRVRSHATRIPR